MLEEEKPWPKKLHLIEEQLEISKNLIKTGEVKVYKEIVEEQKTITVPVQYEELVIETFELHEDQRKKKNVLRIPLSREEVVVTKHPVKVAEVSISKNRITELKQITETIKKEQATYDVTGSVDIEGTEAFEQGNRIH